MRAVVHDRYGPPEVLYVDDVDRPTPNEGEVVVNVRATTVTAGTPWAFGAWTIASRVSSPAFAARGGRHTARSSPVSSRR
jgi:hypothetical protein